MLIRPMRARDVPAAHVIRLRVRENQLSDPSVVKESDYHAFMTRDTMNWICELAGVLAGFAMVDFEKRNLWALFVAPEHEGKGVGKALHDTICSAYFKREHVLRLTTAPDTRAASFYRAAGYTEIGPTPNGRELIFELRG